MTLPYPTSALAAASTGPGELYTFGGSTTGSGRSDIYKMSCPTGVTSISDIQNHCTWENLAEKLDYGGRVGHAAIPISDELADAMCTN